MIRSLRALRSFRLLSIAAILLLTTACSTTLYHPNGKPKFRTYGDSANVIYQDKTTTLQVAGLNHSTPTRASGNAIGNTLSGVIATGALGGGVR